MYSGTVTVLGLLVCLAGLGAACRSTRQPARTRKPVLSDAQRVRYDTKLLKFWKIAGRNLSPNHIITDLANPLPTRGKYGSRIHWSKAWMKHGADINLTNGQVTAGVSNTVIRLRAVLSRGRVTQKKDFPLMILTRYPMQVYFHAPASKEPKLQCAVNLAPWKQAETFLMRKADHGWWTWSVPAANVLQFRFARRSGQAFSPARTKHAFRTSLSKTFIKESIVYPYNPDQPRPKNVLAVLTLNLHTWQEKDTPAKLERVADFIARLKPDFVCLQECAQHKDAAPVTDPLAPWQAADDGLKKDNMAHLIAHRLKQQHQLKYNYLWTWAHYGWQVWEEGVAVLTTLPVTGQGSQYLSANTNKHNIHSRKAVWVRVKHPELGFLNIFSVHTSWWKQGLKQQLAALNKLVRSLAFKSGRGTMICGDFNAPYGSAGYRALIALQLEDEYLRANPFGGQDSTLGSSRIDYILTLDSDPLHMSSAQRYFLDDPALGGRVSDHCAVYGFIKVGYRRGGFK